ncbi:MAG: hypothetical protein AAGE94_14485, partial [Acidobacteriota bacterium]
MPLARRAAPVLLIVCLAGPLGCASGGGGLGRTPSPSAEITELRRQLTEARQRTRKCGLTQLTTEFPCSFKPLKHQVQEAMAS